MEQQLNELGRVINFLLAVAVIARFGWRIAHRQVKPLIGLWPIIFSIQIILFVFLTSSGLLRSNPALLNLLSQVIRAEVLLWMLLL